MGQWPCAGSSAAGWDKAFGGTVGLKLGGGIAKITYTEV